MVLDAWNPFFGCIVANECYQGTHRSPYEPNVQVARLVVGYKAEKGGMWANTGANNNSGTWNPPVLMVGMDSGGAH